MKTYFEKITSRFIRRWGKGNEIEMADDLLMLFIEYPDTSPASPPTQVSEGVVEMVLESFVKYYNESPDADGTMIGRAFINDYLANHPLKESFKSVDFEKSNQHEANLVESTNAGNFYYVDQGIRPAIQLLNRNGFETFESCQGGEGHAFPEPTVRFYGSQMDCIRAYELCELNGLNVFNARRVFAKEPLYNTNETKEIGTKWRAPFNELTFVIHSKTGTIFRPC